MIRPALIAWRKATKSLLVTMENVTEETRDQAIESIDALLDVREKLQADIVAPFTSEEEAFGKELIILEADMQMKLAAFNKQIRSDISEAQSKKGHMKNYVNPYSNVARDGTYYDTKQ